MIINLIGDDDYDSGPYNIRIPAGEIHIEFNVSVIDDNTVESNENFVLVITTESLPKNVKSGNPNKTTVTIVDRDGKSLVEQIEPYSVAN